jgi:hypothetical protein
VWIVTCLEDGENPDRIAGSSIYPAAQNILLATRAWARYDADDSAHRLRERSRRDFRLTVGHPFLSDPSDRLADGSARPIGPRAAQRCRLSRSGGGKPYADLTASLSVGQGPAVRICLPPAKSRANSGADIEAARLSGLGPPQLLSVPAPAYAVAIIGRLDGSGRARKCEPGRPEANRCPR